MMSVFVLAWWLAQGAQPFQAQALVRHATTESGALPNPPATGLGHCLYQWTGVRWRRLQQWSGGGGCPAIERQLVFALAELRQPEYSCFWSASPQLAYAVLRHTFGAGARCG